MIDYKQLQAFATIVDEQSFERAAHKLHITQSAVSQRLKQLEERLGKILLLRSHPLRATEAGHVVLKHYRQIHLLQSEMLDELSHEQEPGFTRLTIGVNADSLATWFLPALNPLLAQHALLLDLRIADQDETQALMRAGEVFGCVSSQAKPLQGCRSHALGSMIYRCWASPVFYEKHFADGLHCADWSHTPIVDFNQSDQLQHRYLKQFFGLDSHTLPVHRLPDSHGFLELIKHGHACGLAPEQQAMPLKVRGEIVDICPDYALTVPLYWHSWQLQTPLSQALTNQLQQACTKWLKPIASNH